MPTTAMRDVNNLMTSANTFAQGINYGADTGVANAFAVTLTPAPTGLTSGMCIEFMAAHANTGVVTLNVNGFGVKAITKNGTAPLTGGEIAANQIVRVIYDGTEFQLISAGFVSFLRIDTANNRLGVGVNPTATLDAGPTGTVNGGEYTVAGTPLAASHLSNGASGSGPVALTDNPTLVAGPNFVPDTGSANAYAVALPGLASLVGGLTIIMLAANANNGPSTLSVNGWPAKNILRNALVALSGGEIGAGQIAIFVYDGIQFQLTNPAVAVYAA